jgi:hypothetical protein
MKRLPDLQLGEVFGSLTITGDAPNVNGHIHYQCVCVCGNSLVLRKQNIKKHTKSCACKTRRSRQAVKLIAGLESALNCDCPGRRRVAGASRMCGKHEAIWHKYKITPTQHREMVVAHAGLCALCRLEMHDDVNVEHRHADVIVRGLVHKYCNMIIDIAETKQYLYTAAVEYLERTA